MRLAGALWRWVWRCRCCAVGQVSSYGDKAEGPNVGDQLPKVLQGATIQQHLNAQLPLGATFTDDHGNPVKLGQYFDGKHPVLLSAVYYNCPMLCSEELDGITSALEMVHLTPGKDFQIVVVSIDPTETSAAGRAPQGLLLAPLWSS